MRLKAALSAHARLDVWEKEPEIDDGLLEFADIATPHIAGYSSDGKANGTAACVRGVSRYFNLGVAPDWQPAEIPAPDNNKLITLDCKGKTNSEIVEEAIIASYDVMRDDEILRNSIATFEAQRGAYPIRREFTYYKAKTIDGNEEVNKTLTDLGFNLAQ